MMRQNRNRQKSPSDARTYRNKKRSASGFKRTGSGKIKYRMAAGTLVIGFVLLLISGQTATDSISGRVQKNSGTQAESKKDVKVEKDEISEEERAANKKKAESALAEDKVYGTSLAALYEKYPQVEKLLLNREVYPDWLIEYFIKHEEAVDWVVDYPEYMEKPKEEIEATALQKVKLKDYMVQGEVPLFLQWDQKWGYASYGSGCVAVDGCGPTCLAMVVTALTGDTSMTPKKVADFSVSAGYFAEEAGTDWNLMEAGARQLGISARQMEKWSVSAVKSELEAGHPMICSMGPGDFTEQGHFIVLGGLTEDGKVILNDPNSKINSRKKWDVQVLLDQMKSMWTYSAE